MTKLEQILDAKKNYMATLKELGRAAIAEQLSNVFAENPALEGVRWNQYTPYFNDGDECVFGLGELEVKIAGGEYDGFWPAQDSKRPFDIALRRFAKSRDKDILRDVFGDHVTVTATPDGVTVEEYDHE